jgi:hypothetical protein
VVPAGLSAVATLIEKPLEHRNGFHDGTFAGQGVVRAYERVVKEQ